MKTKSLLLTAILSLLIVSGAWAQNGERIYIRAITNNPTVAKTQVVIYEKGNVETLEIGNVFSKKEESLKSFADILEKYFTIGYKLIGNSTSIGPANVLYSEYFLEKR
jgi:hypothetical protein